MHTSTELPSGQPGAASVQANGTQAPNGENLQLVDMMIALAKRKKIIIFFPLAVGVCALGLSLMLPNIYTATTKLLPPQQAQSGATALLAQLGGASALAGAAGIKHPSDVYIGMLRSRTVADKLLTRFDLKTRYNIVSHEKARERLSDSTAVAAGKDGLITIAVDDNDKQLVAGIANGYAEELELLTRTLAVTEAAQRRLFFERQLLTAKDNLAKVEVALKGALDSGGVVSVDVESQAILETAARLRAQVSSKEIQLGAMRAFVTAENPEYRHVNEELSSLRNELAKLQGGRTSPASPQTNKRGGLDNIQLMRDLKYNQMLYELLAKQYEVARLDEAKDASLIQVLDKAVEPEFKSKPKRAVLVLGSVLLALFFAIGWAIFAELKQRAMSSPDQVARWNELRSYLRFR